MNGCEFGKKCNAIKRLFSSRRRLRISSEANFDEEIGT